MITQIPLKKDFSLLGRRRYLEKTLTDFNAANKIKNFPIQRNASDGFKIALCQLNLKFRESGLDAHIVLTLHDEIVLEVKKEKAVQA
jgi:DNA polymerase I-like protein with 3'-5' exonuclease and polymerase domains